ncbi:MAG: right-handed parallel beta-helix repeat-containing protein, partial [Bacteroidales bacterium]|nr:right-handed parallel beta-helix repeat-containing protein [Bacteroidales bacterium]
MKKFISLAVGMLMTISAIYSQSVTFPENFDGNTVSYTSIPALAWKVDTYYVSPPNAYLGLVPHSQGQEVILESGVYNFTGYLNVYLHFKHICKVSPLDTIRLEYRISGQNWQIVPVEAYQGEALSYASQGFSSASYPQWKAEDSTALPEQSWWKEETFDLGFYVGAEANVQFRFIIKKGNKAGTDISYGWLLDDIEFIGSKVELKNPLVELQQSSPSGDMYGTGPFSVQVKVESKTSAPIAGAKLYYTSTLNAVVTQDTLTMDSITGTSLWTVTLPLFKLETEVTYYVIGMDALGNMSMAADTFTIETNPNLTYEAVSANLDEFISPVVSQVAGGASIPVTVVLHNKGLNDLTTATIHWSVNGQEQNPPFSYTGALPWEFTTQLNLGNYTSGSGDFDTIKVWVSQPNGVANATNANDTIIIVAYGCAGTMGGAYDFGTGGTFTNWNEFKTTIQNCAPASDITLEFISNYTQALDLTNISNLMNGHTLTLTSKSGDASTTTIQVAGTAITLNNSNNIVIKALTINVSSGTSNRYGINFTGACSNVVVRDCRILASASATATTVVPINKTSTALVHNISFIHNEIEGGGRGINFDGGTNISYGTNIVIDSNSIINAASAGIYFRYANSNSMSFNTIKSRSTVSAVWSGIEIYQANVNNINCNRIFSPGTKTYAVRGLFLYSLNWNYTQDTALISNNEISLFANGNSGSYAAGIYFESCAAKVFYNSIHYAGTRTTNYGIYSLSLANILNIRYNNIVLPSSNSAPIYLTGSRISETWDIDYNNFQAPTYVGYALNKNISSTAEWQSIITTDKNTLRIAPVYSPGVTQSLEQANYAGFVAPVHPEVLTDIDGNSRGSLTNMGCYHGALSNTDAMLSDLTGWKTSVLIGQQDSLKAVIWNIGSTALDSIVFQCSVGGVSQTRLWVGSIPSGAIDTITLCNMNYTSAGQYPIEVYIDNLGDMVDNNKANDTLRVSSYVCQGSLSGTKTIGAGVGNDFATIGDAIYELTQCGASNDVIFSIEAGAYPENINLTDISNYTNGYTLTLTSQSNTVGGDVTVSPASGNGITLNNSNRIVLKNLTINVSSDERHGIIFTSGCTNVVIRDCRIIATQTATSATAVTIFKASGTGVVDSLFILHNELDGGYAEIMFDGGVSADYGDCINVDSNTCTNARYAGININYSNINSFSGNTILSRPTPVASWTGISLGNSNGDVVGNRIRMSQHNYSGRMIGINLATHQINYATNKALIANNEIILVGNDANTNAVTTGIILNRVNAKILHNSIFISGGDNTKTPCGLSFSSGYSVAMEIKYNNIVLSNPNGLPIMVGNADRVTVCDIDYNNLYAPNYVWGFDYDGNKYSTIESYREIAPSDRNSFRLPVIFPNAQDLKQNDYTGFSMPTSADVPADIDGENRSTTTHIGCYHGAFPNADAEMRAFFDLKQGGVFGQQHSVNVIVFNGGAVTLDTMVFHLAINNNTPTSYTWTGNLPFGMLDTITIGTVNYTTAGDMNIKAYIANLGTLKTDDNVSNDTLQANIYICATPMVGTKIIGSSGSRDFATIEDALSQLVTCGANGDVIFAFEPGIYPADIDLSGISSCLNGHTLTITSQNGIASEVTITKASGNGIGFILKNSQNIIIRDLTIDLHLLTSNAFGINFQGACSNITIRGCHILSDPTAINQLAIPIYKENATGRADNISIVDNVIEGGGYGIYFYAGSNSTNYGVNIRIDSNTIKDAHPSAILIRYTDFKSIFANTFISRATQTSAWLGLDLDNCNGDIIGNRFDVPGNSVSFGIKGMSLMSHNALVPNAALICNNELLLGSTKGPNMWGEIESYGILFAGANNAKVMYNSIYFAGNVANHGFRLYSGTYNQLEIKYNNVVMAGNAAYPFYSESANINVRDIDYNNFYAPQYVASTNYGSNNIASIAAWQTAVSTDKNSVRVLPVFVDGTTPTASLKIQNKDSLQCPLSSSVVDDIEGKQRYAVTQMGAYTSAPQSLDMALWKITNTNAMSGYLFDVEVEAANLGLTDIDTALLKWSINGNYQGSLLWEASPKMAS